MKLFTVTSGERSEVVQCDQLVQEGDVLSAEKFTNSVDGTGGFTRIGQWKAWTEWKEIPVQQQ